MGGVRWKGWGWGGGGLAIITRIGETFCFPHQQQGTPTLVVPPTSGLTESFHCNPIFTLPFLRELRLREGRQLDWCHTAWHIADVLDLDLPPPAALSP